MKRKSYESDEYKILSYIQKHYWIATIIVSFITTIMVAAINTMAFCKEKYYCNEWHIPSTYITSSGGNSYFETLATIIFIFSMILFTLIVRNNANKCSYVLVYEKIYEKKVADAKISDEERAEIKSNIPLMRKATCQSILIQGAQALLAGVILYPGLFLQTYIGNEANVKLWVLIGLPFILVIVFLFIEIDWFSVIKPSDKQLEKELEVIKREFIEILEVCTTGKFKIKVFFSDSNIKKALKYVAAIIIVVLFIFVGLLSNQEKAGYWCYEDAGGDQYVVVYNSNDVIILAKAEWEDNKVIIHRDEQLYMKVNKEVFKYKKVDEIDKI